MKLRDILTIVASGSQQDSVVALSQKFSAQNRGRISGLAVSSMPVLVMTEGWVASPVWEDVRKHARTRLETEREQLQSRLEAEQAPGLVASELLEDGQTASAIASRARHFDLSVVGCPQTDTEQRILEAVLFGSGRPVLLAPHAWASRPIGERVVVAWKPTRQAARALSDAEDLLLQACRTVVLTVDTDHREDECRRSGGEIAAHLERRGVKAEACAIAPIGRTEARAVLDHAAAIDADLIVMGGFGRSRMSEFIFGGMTREMVRTATIPVLMSH